MTKQFSHSPYAQFEVLVTALFRVVPTNVFEISVY